MAMRRKRKSGREGNDPPSLTASSRRRHRTLQVAIYESGISCFRVGFRCSQFDGLREAETAEGAAPETRAHLTRIHETPKVSSAILSD